MFYNLMTINYVRDFFDTMSREIYVMAGFAMKIGT